MQKLDKSQNIYSLVRLSPDKVRERMFEAGLSPYDLAYKAGVNIKTIYRALGHRRIQIGTASRIAKALGSSILDLI